MARELLGQALHAVQDYYSHTNWLETHQQPGQIPINDNLGRGIDTMFEAESTCGLFPAQLSGAGLTGGITSGYYLEGDLLDRTLCNPVIRGGSTRCIHGDITPLIGCRGINKDLPNVFIPIPLPGLIISNLELHAPAKEVAVRASVDFVQQIIDDINEDNSIEDKDGAIRTLLGQPELSIRVFMSGTFFDTVTFTADPFGPTLITDSIFPSDGIHIAIGDAADGGVPGKLTYTGNLLFTASAGPTSITQTFGFLPREPLGDMVYDSESQAWIINFPPEADFSGVTSLRIAVYLIYHDFELFVDLGVEARDCEMPGDTIFDVPLPVTDIQVVDFTIATGLSDRAPHNTVTFPCFFPFANPGFRANPSVLLGP